MILRQIASRKEILSRNNWFMTSQDKTFARIVYLGNETKSTIKLSRLLCEEKKFAKAYGIQSDDLMKRYKLTQEQIDEFMVLLEDEIKPFTNEEKNYITSEYGK